MAAINNEKNFEINLNDDSEVSDAKFVEPEMLVESENMGQAEDSGNSGYFDDVSLMIIIQMVKIAIRMKNFVKILLPELV